MLTKVLHRLAAHPWVYDRIQALAGQEKVVELLSREIAPLNPKVVVDIGGGTGSTRRLFTEDCRYICLDLEMPKLSGFRSKAPTGLAVLGDATSMPIIDSCADMVVCKSVTHHMTNLMLERALDESRRVLRVGGYMILLDAVLNQARFAGRVLWSLDRGSYPRSEHELQRKLSDRFKIIHWEKFAIYHEYVFGIGVRHSGAVRTND
jgi:ubiquinone/menaquinone biosynthesis C-methylase UbiE